MKNESTTQASQDLLRDLHALVAEAEKMLSNAVGNQSDETVNALRSRFESARDRFANFYTTTRRKIVSGAKSTDETIRANPYQSLAIALGAGLVAGVLLGRRSR